MALDGAFLRYIKNELNDKLIGSRIDKIFQPNKYEFIFSFRSKTDTFKLLISSRANSARVHITKHSLENPKTPFMLCMLFRKKLIGAKLISIEQKNLERALYIKFESTDELGDKVFLTLAIEIMGQYSNVILIDKNNVIIDAIKRVSSSMSSKRQIFPGIKYSYPPKQNKTCILNCSVDKLANSIYEQYKSDSTKQLTQVFSENIQGISNIVCKELEYNSLKKYGVLTYDDLKKQLTLLKSNLSNLSGYPTIKINEKNEPIDFSFIKLNHLKKSSLIFKDTFSSLLDDFFFEKDRIERIKNSSQNYTRILKNAVNKLKKKIKVQEKELNISKNREKLKISADLIAANSFKISKGMSSISLENFYDESLTKINVKLDPSLDAHQNAQKYYKKYSKLKNAENILKKEIEKSNLEIKYIDTILDEIARTNSLSELQEIKKELISQNYIKEKKSNGKKNLTLTEPLKFLSPNGFTILVGKNNVQNDRLTLKIANKNDIWLHVKDCPGSHTIIRTNGKNIDDSTLLYAANLAAIHSKCKNSSNVAIDYTLIKNVTKPSNFKPGMVIYKDYKTLYVTPEIYI